MFSLLFAHFTSTRRFHRVIDSHLSTYLEMPVYLSILITDDALILYSLSGQEWNHPLPQ